MTLRRLPDWAVRLRVWLGAMHRRPFRPGEHDCCLFGAGAVEAQTGVDLAASWRGRYTTYAGGRRLLRQAGYNDHVDLIARHLIAAGVSAAMPGDIVVLPGKDAAVGVVQGAAAYVLTPSGRLGLVAMAPGMRLFKVA